MLGLTARLADPGLCGRVIEILDRRLEPRSDAPVALALSGGGDSMALLEVAADWAKLRARRLLCLTVDHGVQPDSPRWTAFAQAAARARGADWRGLVWEGKKPTTGLQAAARGARHALVADAAREGGARVVLFAHTLDDVREADAMRDAGTAIGRVQEWAPSPAWPQGRGLVLLRPLLGVRRDELRGFLIERGRDWIEDPANEDVRYARARVRNLPSHSTGEGSGMEVEPQRVEGRAGGASIAHPSASTSSPPSQTLPPSRGKGFEVDGAGVITFDRAAIGATTTAFIAVALLCAAGTSRPPRGDRLQRLTERLRSGETFTTTLCGARIEADEVEVRFMRDPGETARGGLAPLSLTRGSAAVWDGRFEVVAEAPCEIRPLKGLAAKLSHADRARVAAFPPAARAALPVVLGNRTLSPAIACSGVRVRCLVRARLRLACGVIAHEKDIADRSRGAPLSASLC